LSLGTMAVMLHLTWVSVLPSSLLCSVHIS
jgi:hypothetical protein